MYIHTTQEAAYSGLRFKLRLNRPPDRSLSPLLLLLTSVNKNKRGEDLFLCERLFTTSVHIQINLYKE